MRPLDLALAVGATLRLTRFVTTDSLGKWIVRDPANRWARQDAARHLVAAGAEPDAVRDADDETVVDQAADLTRSKRARLVSGLACPYCVGFYIGAAMLAAAAIASRGPRRRGLFRAVAAPLTLNYATAHVSSRID